MTIIDADKFLSYLIYSKHIDGLTCGEVKKAVEMSKVDVLDKIRDEIDKQEKWLLQAGCTACNVDIALDAIKSVVAESEVQDADSD